MDQVLGLVVFEVVLVAIGVADNIVQRGFPNPRLHQDPLLVLNGPIEFLILLPQLLDCLNIDIVNRHRFLALGIRVDAIVEEERVVIDDAATVESLYEEFLVFEALHVVRDFYHSALDDVHFARVSVQLVEVGVFLELLLLHVEDPLVTDVFAVCRATQVLKEADLL